MLDSTETSGVGRYQFSVGAPDSNVVYFVSVDFQDIGYLSPTLNLWPGQSDSVPTIVVYDTSYASPTIALLERHIIVRHIDVDGTRQIIELMTLGNDGRSTRIAADTSAPVWQGLLPAGASQMAVGESEVGAGAVYSRGGRLAVAAPIPPGEKQLLVSYVVPPADGQLVFPVDQPVARLTLSVEDTSAVATGDGLVFYGVEQVGGTMFKRYDAGNLSGGTALSVRFATAFFTIEKLELALVVIVVLTLTGTLTWWLRKQRESAAQP